MERQQGGVDDPAKTMELARGRPTERLPAAPGDLRDHLPGLEPDRQITDWGRSERIEGLVDRTLYELLYRYWFRVEVEGIENVPFEGGALLVANHAGPLPPDGAMIAKAIKEEHRRPRPVHFATAPRFSAIPGLGMLLMKVGGVSEHPANLHRLLFDEGQLVLLFPEGREGASKPINERYRLRQFNSASFVKAATRARVPIVPIAVVGSEEAAPVFARIGLPGRFIRLPRLPLTTAIPLPAKFKIRFLLPLETDGMGERAWEDDGLIQSVAHDVRALIQENLLEMVSQRRSVWLG